MEDRKNILVRNTKFGVYKIIVQYFLQFIVRTVFIRTLGQEYLGLSGLFTNILGCLSIVDLGFGTAIAYSMYKPVAESDYLKIRSLYALYGKIYLIISLVILVMGLNVIPFLDFIIKGDSLPNINITFLYILSLFNILCGYIWANKKTLLFVNQRNDIENKISIISLFLTSVFQIGILILTKNYYLYTIASTVFIIFEGILVNIQVRKLFPYLRGDVKPLDNETKLIIKKNALATGMLQVGGALITSTDNILISSMIGLSILGSYTNYSTIIQAITAFISLIVTTSRSTIGNMIASYNSDYVYEKYKTFNFLTYWIAGFCAICLICLLNPFILIWTGSSNYLLEMPTVIVLVVNFLISTMLSMTNNFKLASGLMWFDKWKTIIQGIINLTVSIILAKNFGLIGIFIGTSICYIVPLFAEPYILYKHYFNKKQGEYWFRFAVHLIITLITGCLVLYICSLIANTISGFILKLLICLIVPNLIFMLCYLKTTQFKESIAFLKEVIIKKIKNNTKNERT